MTPEMLDDDPDAPPSAAWIEQQCEQIRCAVDDYLTEHGVAANDPWREPWRAFAAAYAETQLRAAVAAAHAAAHVTTH